MRDNLSTDQLPHRLAASRRRAIRAALIAAVILFATMPGAAAWASTAGVVFSSECRAIDPKITGFTCSLRRQGLALHWIEKQSAMPAARRERALYEHEKIVLRYFELGGRAFDVTADHWPAGAKRTCYAIKPRYRAYTCVDEKAPTPP